jgi:glycosyltransferase involved in cell wall biosynthesis
MTCDVSVVMSVYNGCRYLTAALESILSQTDVSLEFIIVDDGSTDDSPRILNEYSARDPRVRLIRQANQGLTRALIHGCSLAQAPLIARQDADDRSAPQRLAIQRQLLERDPSLGFVSCATQYIGPQDEPLLLMQRPAPPIEATRQLLDERQGPPAHGSVMFRRSLYDQVGGYRSQFYYGQDADLWLRMGQHACVGYASDVLYYWRRSPDGISGAMSGLQHQFGELGQACLAARRAGRSEEQYLKAAEQLTNIARSRSNTRGSGYDRAMMSYLIGRSLADAHDQRAYRYYWDAVRHHPLYWRAWIRLAGF